MDDFDRAQRLEEQDRERALRSHFRKPTGAGGDDGIGCGDPIDVARKLAVPGATRCVECQRLLEHEPKRR